MELLDVSQLLLAGRFSGFFIAFVERTDVVRQTAWGSDIARLEAAGVQLKRTRGRGGGILHDKYAIVEGRLLVTGSYKWSTNAEENNDKNTVFARDQAVFAAFQTNFNSMWGSR